MAKGLGCGVLNAAWSVECHDGEVAAANAHRCVDVLERSNSPECCGDEHKGESDLEEQHASHQERIEDSHKTVDAL